MSYNRILKATKKGCVFIYPFRQAEYCYLYLAPILSQHLAFPSLVPRIRIFITLALRRFFHFPPSLLLPLFFRMEKLRKSSAYSSYKRKAEGGRRTADGRRPTAEGGKRKAEGGKGKGKGNVWGTKLTLLRRAFNLLKKQEPFLSRTIRSPAKEETMELVDKKGWA